MYCIFVLYCTCQSSDMQLTGDASGCNEVESAYCLEMKLVIQDMQIPVHNTQRWLWIY